MLTTTSKTEIVDQHIFTKAGHLIGKNNYTEKKSTAPYKLCDRLFINHSNKSFWFTTKSHVEHTNQLTN